MMIKMFFRLGGELVKKIWNGLRYGDGQTRACIGGVLLFAVLAVVLMVVSCLSGKFGIFILGLLSAVVAIIISQTFHLVEDSFVAVTDSKGGKNSVRAYSAKKINAMEQKKDKEPETHTKGETGHETEEAKRFDGYNQQYMKKIYRKYHVKKDHRPIIIDSSDSYHIKECPAFIWRVHNKVYLLLLEKEPRKIAISRDLITHMEYEPKVRCDRSKEYLAFKKENLVTGVFREFLPDYFESKAQNRNLKYKNLYKLHADIMLTNRSAYTVMDLLCLDFVPKDKITQSDKLNSYFKKVYAAYILYQDKVYSITEYKNQIEEILKELCYSDVPRSEFQATLDNMVKGRMISREYADYYSSLKDKKRLS